MTRSRRSAWLLAAAVLAGTLAIAPPLDRLVDRSFAWHMMQHLILVYVVALLVVAARPFELFARLAGKGVTAATVRAMHRVRALAAAPVALAFFLAALWGTHFSALYELSLERAWPHAGEHLLFLAAGIAFWMPVLAPPPLRPLPFPARLLYLAVALPQGALIGMAIGAARAPLYPHYVTVAGSVSAALADQRNAAALMWIAGGLSVFAAFLLTLAEWARRESAEAGIVSS